MNTPCLNHEVKKAFVFSLYTAFRWADIKPLVWENIKGETVSIIQKKTGIALEIPLHKIAREIIGKPKTGLVFNLPTPDGANKILRQWCADAKLKKHITWHCARHSFSVLMQMKGTDIATVAGMLGHTSTSYVHKTYQRYIKKEAQKAILHLPEL
jgi:integrase